VMRPVRLGLLAALLAAFLAPAAAMAQKKGDAGPYNAAQLKRGAAEGADAAQAAGINCQVAGAAWVGSTKEDKKTNTPERNLYEVACTGSMGFMVQVDKGGAAMPFSCLESMSGAACKMAENQNSVALFQQALAKNGATCDVANVRLIGQVPTAQAVYMEALCKQGTGYVVKTSMPLDLAKPIKAEDCLIYDIAETNVKCTLADKAARLLIVDKFASAAAPAVACTLKDRRFIGPLKDGTIAYEAACDTGKGYVLKVDSKGSVASIECAKAPTLCELSDARQAMTEQAGLYTNLAKAAGSSCVVESYAVFPPQAGQEVLELTCKDGSEVVGVFPARGAGKVYDCGHALVAGFRCAPGKLDYSPLTADLKKLGKADCVVSEVQLRAKSSKGNPQIEVACADGLPGYVVEYKDPATPLEALGCALAGCGLEANKKKKG
jgi:hypothetical protein